MQRCRQCGQVDEPWLMKHWPQPDLCVRCELRNTPSISHTLQNQAVAALQASYARERGKNDDAT